MVKVVVAAWDGGKDTKKKTNDLHNFAFFCLWIEKKRVQPVDIKKGEGVAKPQCGRDETRSQ